MKTCSKCQCEFEDRFKFCPECGSSSGVSSESLAGFSMGAQRTMENVSAKGQAEQDDRSMGDHQTMINKPAEVKGSFQGATESVDDRYESLEEIGRGGFARVWKARDRKLDRIVALKRLMPESLSGSEGARTLERFRREANAIASLNHRNIVGVYDRGEDAKGPYIVMEYVGGGSLKDLLRRQKKLEVVTAVKLAIGIARGLDHAHRKNLVHRDIKPANILLHEEASESVPKISDFGLARMGVDTGVSMSGYGMGTLTYMPPEQRRDAKNVNHTADIYALGKTLYEMVTGEVPDDVDVDKLPPGLVEVVKRCVKPNPEERYFSVAELLSALEGVGSGMNEKRPQNPVGGGTDSNACPSCGTSNVPGLKFCGKCGGGLTRSCPECGADVSVHSQFCGGCGTDVPAFGRFANGVAQMEKFAAEKHWSRVLKEHGLLPSGAKLEGSKGKELGIRARNAKEMAEQMISKKSELRTTVESSKGNGLWNEAHKALKALLEIDPHDASLAGLAVTIDEACELAENAEEGIAAGNPEMARSALDELLKSVELRCGAERFAVGINERLERFEQARERAMKAMAGENYEAGRLAASEALETAPDSAEAKQLLRTCEEMLVRLEKRNKTIAVAVVLGMVLVIWGWVKIDVVRECSTKLASALTSARQPKTEAETACSPAEGEPWTSPATGMEFVWISALKLWVGKYEVTNGEYRKMSPSHDSKAYEGHSLNGDRQPVIYVNFDDAKAYAVWQTERDKAQLGGLRYRVISEAEWLACAQCGDGREYPWGKSMPPKYGNYDKTSEYDDGYVATCPVEKSGWNDWGLYGIGGNVWECCASDASGSSFGGWRGASWRINLPGDLRCACRSYYDGSIRINRFGFRLVL